MPLRQKLRNVVVAALVTGIVATPMGAASAGDPPVHDQQIQNTLKDLMRDAEKLGGGKVTLESLTRAVEEKKTTNSWERNVDFDVVDTHSSAFGQFSIATAPDGSIGMATRSADGGCTMTTYKDGKTTTWSLGDVGKNCTGKSALGGKDSTVPYVDPVPPGAPTGVAATPGDSVVTLSWTAPADTDLHSYEVLVDGGIVATVPAGTTSAEITGLTNYTEYRFQVRAVDQAENVSQPTDEVRATPIDLTAPAIPAPVSVQDGDSRATITWTAAPETDLAGYRIYVDGVLHTEVPAGTTSLEITGLTNYQTYRIEVSSHDVNGNESARTEPVETTPVDLTAPAVPADVTVKDGDTLADVNWTANTEDDLAGYRIYVDGVLHTDVPAGTTTLRLTGLQNGTQYQISVSSYDRNGNESLRSGEVTASPRDLTPPPTPTGLRVTSTTASSIALSWTAVTAPDLSHYNVYVDGILAARTTGTGTTHTLTGLTGGRTYKVTVAAVDKAGNVSAHSNLVSATTTADTTPPTWPTGLTVTSGDSQATLNWAANKEADLAGYRVYRQGVLVAELPAGTTTFTDTGLVNGRSYYYNLRAFDTSGNASSTSSTVYAYPKDAVAPGAPIDLTGEALGSDQVKLTWTAPADNDVSYYRIHVNGTVVASSSLLTYTVKELAPGASHTFRVQAVDTSGNAGTPSETITVTTGPQQPGTTAITGQAGTLNGSTAMDTDGNIYVTGGSSAYSNGVATSTARRFNATTQTWELLPIMPRARAAHLSAVDKQGRLFVFAGGRAETDMYDPATNKWTTITGGLTYSSGATVVTDQQGRFIVTGGYSSYVTRFDPATLQWSLLASLPQARHWAASVIDSQGRVYVIGGYRPREGIYEYTTATVWRLNAEGTAWTTLPSFPNAGGWGRAKLAATIDQNDVITIVGGVYNTGNGYFGNYQSNLQRYNPVTNSWTEIGSVGGARSAATTDAAGNTWVVGGTTWSGFYANITKIDPAGKITRMTNLKVPRGDLSQGDAVFTPDGNLHVTNGATWSNGYQEPDGRLWKNNSNAITVTKAERYIPLP